jgi:hypothetical protein
MVVEIVTLSIFSFFSSLFLSHIVTTQILRRLNNPLHYHNYLEVTNSGRKKIRFDKKVKYIIIPSYDDAKMKELWYTNQEYELFKL